MLGDENRPKKLSQIGTTEFFTPNAEDKFQK